MKRYAILIYPAVVIGLYLFVWFTGQDPISSSHAFDFLMHQDKTLMIFLAILMLASNLVAIIGTFTGMYSVTTSRGWWIGAIITMFAVMATFAYTRLACNTDPNIASRYLMYAIQQGWK